MIPYHEVVHKQMVKANKPKNKANVRTEFFVEGNASV
jgi:hypothetical protein